MLTRFSRQGGHPSGVRWAKGAHRNHPSGVTPDPTGRTTVATQQTDVDRRGESDGTASHVRAGRRPQLGAMSLQPWIDRAKQRRAAAAETLETARGRHPLFGLVLDVVDSDRAAGGALLAGALAFRLFLWLLPAGLLVVGLLGFVSPDESTDAASEAGLGAYTTSTIANASASAHQGRWLLVVFGLVTLYWTSGTLARTLWLATSLAWRIPIQRFHGRTRGATGVAVGMFSVLGVTLVANWMRALTYPIGMAVTLTLVVVFAVAAWVLLAVLPHPPDADAVDLLPGALLIGLGTQAMHLVTTLYLGEKLSSSSQLYGALGGAATILLWAYFLARILVAASTVNRSWLDYRLRRPGLRVEPGEQPPWTWHTIPRTRSGWKEAIDRVRSSLTDQPGSDGQSRPAISLTAWTFDDPEAAIRAVGLVQGGGTGQGVEPRDWAVVSWPSGARRPDAGREALTARDGALGASFWGLLFGLVFFAPELARPLSGGGTSPLTSFDLGLGQVFVQNVRTRLSAGTSGLFVVGDETTYVGLLETLTPLRPVPVRAELSPAVDESLRSAFAR